MARKKRGEGQTALITGASGGIGLDLAADFARDGYDLILTARSGDKLDAAGQRLTQYFGVRTHALPLDLGAIGGGARLHAQVKERNLNVDVLVNNAGFGHAGGFADAPLEPQLGMIDLNIRALVELTHLCWPAMLAANRGGVINVASTAAFQPGPLMAVYYASKAFVLSFSEALWEEARGTNVKVSCLCPGPTATGFRDRAGTGETRLSNAGTPMTSKEVSKIGYRAFHKNRRVVITGARNKVLAGIAQTLPKSTVLRMVKNMQSPK